MSRVDIETAVYGQPQANPVLSDFSSWSNPGKSLFMVNSRRKMSRITPIHSQLQDKTWEE